MEQISLRVGPAVPGIGHDELASAWAEYISSPHRRPGYITWENIEMPERCRPDVFALPATLTDRARKPVTFEIKVTRADLLSDLRSEKWRRYLPFSTYVRIVTLPGIVDAEELPPELGLVIKDGRSWVAVKRGRLNSEWKLTDKHWHNLCLKARNPSPWERRVAALSARETNQSARR